MSRFFKTMARRGEYLARMKIKLHTINLEVADPQTSKRFYIDALGMTENLRRSHAPDFVYLESAGGNLTLAAPRAAAGAEPSRTTEIGFEVDDLEALREQFGRQGVLGFTSQSMGWAEVIEGHDPDGYRVIVYCFTEG